jgi:hypothetical protein
MPLVVPGIEGRVFSSTQAIKDYLPTMPEEARKRLSPEMKSAYGISESGKMGGAAGDILSKLESATEEARQRNLQRYEEAKGIYGEIEAMYAPGGTFGAGYEAQLATQKKRDVAAQVAQSVSSGLFGTTAPATAAKSWEETVGAPARLKLEDIRMEKLAEAKQAKAGLIERREDIYPDYGLLAGLISQGSQSPRYQYNAPTSSEPWYPFGRSAWAQKKPWWRS